MRDRFLRLWSRLVLDHSQAVLLVVLVISIAAAVVVPGLRVEAGHSKMEAEDNVHYRRFDDFLNKFGSPNMLIALAEGGDEALRQQLITELHRVLPAKDAGGAGGGAPGACTEDGPANSSGCVRDVVGQVDIEGFKGKALLYVPTAQLKTLVESLEGDEGVLTSLIKANSLASVLSVVTAELKRRAHEPAPKGEARDRAEKAMEAVASTFDELTRRVKEEDRAKVSLEEALFPREVQGGVDAKGYFSATDGTFKLCLVRPVNDSDEPLVVVPFVDYVQRQGDAAASRLSEACAKDKARCKDGPLKVTLTGMPAIVADETRVLTRDIALTSAVALLGILALFFLGFRSLRQTVLGLLPLLIGMLWTLALVHLLFGSLNLVTSAFIVTLLGLGIDFAVHLLSRFNEGRLDGMEPREAAESALLGAGPGILTGALTTAGAFIALASSEFLAFAQLGLITGVGLICVLLVTLSVMPAMLVTPRLRFLQGKGKPRTISGSFFGIPDLVVKYRGVVILAGLGSAAAMLVTAQSIPWSYDYMKLMPGGLASVEAMEKITLKSDFSAEVSAVVASSIEEARGFQKKLTAKGTIRRAESLAAYIPLEQQQKKALLARLAPVLKGRAKTEAVAVDLEAVQEAVEEFKDALEEARFDAKSGGADKEAALLDKPVAAVVRLDKALSEVPEADATRRLGKLQASLIDGLDQGLTILEKNLAAEAITVERLLAQLPSGMSDRLYSDGKFAVMAYPAKPIWEKAFLEQLVKDLRDVQAEATGFPVTHWETSSAIERGFKDASIIALLALVILLTIDFRSLRFTLLALAPLGMGVAWMWGGVSLLGLSYNFVNIIAFPLIIGIGVASGVHILHRYRQEGERHIAPVVRHTGMAIFLSAATTMVGFGSLSLASHRGAASLGNLLLLGVGACLLTAVLVLPAVIAMLGRHES